MDPTVWERLSDVSSFTERVDMKVDRVDILEVHLPFRMVFGHSLAKRKSSTNLWVRVHLQDGIVGHGEAVPRAYVTGETVAGAAQRIGECLGGSWWRRGFGSLAEVAEVLEERYEAEGPEQGGAARCALELALLDAAGKRFGQSCADLLGGVRAQQVEYSAVFPFVRHPLKLLALALRVRSNGMRTAKVKVGQGPRPDGCTLSFARWAIGAKGDLRVDGNACWNAEQALAELKPMIARGIRAVEQPLPAEDVEGLARVAAAIEPLVIVDESFHTLADARRLIEQRACDALNIRISKCGGLLTSKRILMEARARGVPCQLGAQVGESGILTAAGRAFACAYPELLYREGAAGRFLLEEDLTREDTTFGPGGFAPALPGPGLGVTVDEERLARCSQALATIAA
jgi:L-alanine-DL-glutamate epimerase-like enolase superfamily enzyme